MLESVLTGELCFSSLRPLDLSTCTKQDIQDYFENSYNLNESIFVGLKDESVFYKRPDRLRLPLIFYYGHTACVYVNKLILCGLVKPEERVNLTLETILETGVDEMSWDDTENLRMGGKFEWPRVQEIVEYRRQVRELILQVIEDTPLQLPINIDSPWWGLVMGMEHERIHLETSSVLIRQLPVHMVTKPDGFYYAPSKSGKSAGENNLLCVEAQEVTLGKPLEFPSFGWDNEYGNVKLNVPAFEASQYLITNKEFLQFIEDKGYEQRQYWSDEGWNWKKFRGARHPTFWVCDQECPSGCGADLGDYSHCTCPREQSGKRGERSTSQHSHDSSEHCHDSALNSSSEEDVDIKLSGHLGMDEDGGLEFGFRYRCVFSEIPMPMDWPAEVNYHEARAFCAWKGPDFRLPAEAEHNVLRGTQPPVSEGTSCDIIFKEMIPANLNFQYGSSSPVNFFPPTAAGFYDVAGNVWQWTEDHFNGLPGYETCYMYDDFSSPSFDGRHTVILGGSWISTGDEASRFARYAFRRHFFQHSGFRMVRSLPSGNTTTRVQTPIRLCNSKVYVLGAGVPENRIHLDSKKVSYTSVPSSCTQYHYEKDEVVNDTLRFEYACKQPFSVSLSAFVKNTVDKYNLSTDSALHMGCGTGRATFELADVFDKVLGQDFCAQFINTCLKLQEGQIVEFEEFDGFKKNKFAAFAPESSKLDKIIFKQLTWLPNEVQNHEMVLITFLDRVQNPKAWIVRLPEIVRPGGMLVLASATHNEDTLKLLHQRFKLLETESLPFSDNGANAEITIWRK